MIFLCTESRTDEGKHRHSRFICASISYSRDRSIGSHRTAPSIPTSLPPAADMPLLPLPTPPSFADAGGGNTARFVLVLPSLSALGAVGAAAGLLRCCPSPAAPPSLYPSLSHDPSFLPSFLPSFRRRRASAVAVGRPSPVGREKGSAIMWYPSGLSVAFPPSPALWDHLHKR